MSPTKQSAVAMRLAWAVGLALSLPTSAHAQANPCRAAKLNVASRHIDCRLRAAAQFAKSSQSATDLAKRDAAYTKCDARLASGWAAADSKYGAGCPSAGSGAVAPAAIGDPFLPDAQQVVDYLADAEGRILDLLPYRYPVLRTGQETSYGDGTDGDLRKGTPRAFVDKGDGTILDKRTGLMWEKKSRDDSVHRVSGGVYGEFLPVLNSPGACFAGHCDWRHPTVEELLSLVNWQREGGIASDSSDAARPKFFAEFTDGCAPGCTVDTCCCPQSGAIQTSSRESGKRWTVSVSSGAFSVRGAGSTYQAVRGGSASRAFLDSSDSLLD